MEQLIDRISEIQRMIEREVEWPLTDHVSGDVVNPHLRVINANLMMLQGIAEQIEKEQQ